MKNIAVILALLTICFVTNAFAILPKTIQDVGTYGEDLYDMAKEGDFEGATKTFQQLQQISNRSQDLDLKPVIEPLDQAIKSKNRLDIMEQANQLTLIGIELSAPYDPSIPVDVARLDYYGREIEVQATANDIHKVRVAVRGMRDSWNRVRPMLEAKGGLEEALRFNDLVVEIEHAQTPDEFIKLANRELEQMDKIEFIFE